MIDDDDLLLFDMPDFDDTLIRLSNLFRMHRVCRRRTCRWHEGCQGGFGPPCYLQYRRLFADAVLYELDEYRAFWGEQRRKAKARPASTSS